MSNMINELDKLLPFAQAIVNLHGLTVEEAALENRVGDLKAAKSELEAQVARLLEAARQAKVKSEESEREYLEKREALERDHQSLSQQLESQISALQARVSELMEASRKVEEEEKARLALLYAEHERRIEDYQAKEAALRASYDGLKRALEQLKREHGLV